MNPVEWLENLLHGINPTWVWIVLSYLVCLFLIMKLMQAKGMADRKAEDYRMQLENHFHWEFKKANSPGPQVTAKTLREEQNGITSK